MYRRGHGRAFWALLSVAIVASVALVVVERISAPATDHAIHLVPRDATGYVHAFLKPSTSQRRALRDLLTLFPELEEEDDAADGLLVSVLSNLGVRIDPGATEWVGDEVAAFSLEDGSTAVLLAIDDEERALSELGAVDDGRAIEVVDGFAIVGDEAAVSATVTESDDSLAESDQVTAWSRHLESHRIVTFYGRDPTLLARAFGLPSPALKSASMRPAAASLRVESDSVVLDFATFGYPSGPQRGIRHDPADATFAIDLNAAGPTTGELQRFLLLGRARAARGRMTLGIARLSGHARIDMSTEETAREAMARLRAFVDEDLRQDIVPHRDGFSFAPGFPLPETSVSVKGSSLRLRAGDPAASPQGATLGQERRVTGPLGSGFVPLLFADMGAVPSPLKAFAFRQLPLSSVWEQALQRLLTVNFGFRQSGDTRVERLVVTFGAS